jgi:adenine-specific DNA-methyltransferase
VANVAQSRKQASRVNNVSVQHHDLSKALARSVDTVSLDIARTVVHHIARGWWKALIENAQHVPTAIAVAPYVGPLVDLGDDVAESAEALGVDLGRLPVGMAAAAIGRLYCDLLPSSHRRTNGIYYTPSPLVARLLDQAEAAGHDWGTGKVIDPSCGGGAFLIDAARRILLALGPAEPAFVIASVSARLRGWDLDPFAAWLSHVCVEASLLAQVITSGKRLAPITETRDSLAGWDGHAGAYALVMGNPAFGKMKDSEWLRGRFRRSLHGHPNRYGLFMDLAVHLAAPYVGIIAYLTPTSYFGGRYFRELRRLLAKEAPPFTIDIVESRRDVFEDVLQEVALSVFHRGLSTNAVRCSAIHINADTLWVESSGYLILPADPTEAWLMPRNASDAPFVERMLSMPCRLCDWGYSVSTGPLVWNRKKDKLHDKAREGSVPVVWAESVGDRGNFRLKPENPKHAPFYEPSGPRDSNLVRAPCLLVQRTTAKEQERRLVSAAMPASVIKLHGVVAVENHLNMVIAAKARPEVPMKVLAAFFASETADRVMRCINASVAVSASEIEAMPLPTAEEVVAAMASDEPEAALRGLYGIER